MSERSRAFLDDDDATLNMDESVINDTPIFAKIKSENMKIVDDEMNIME
jgi:hypothetical protein